MCLCNVIKPHHMLERGNGFPAVANTQFGNYLGDAHVHTEKQTNEIGARMQPVVNIRQKGVMKWVRGKSRL